MSHHRSSPYEPAGKDETEAAEKAPAKPAKKKAAKKKASKKKK